jgi:hypothetical protein
MTAMSRKFYNALAKKFDEVRPAHPNQYVTWLLMVTATVNVIAEGNPSFDKARFLRACGVHAASPQASEET